jgi:hypothetical protein
MPESLNGHRSPTSGNPKSLATRHLCAVTHMRRFMLSDESFESEPSETAPKRWVGRAYALSVLADEQRTGPMPGVDIGKVKEECWSAIRQTLLRDATVIAVIAMAAIFDPQGTFIMIGLTAAGIALAGRIKTSLPLVLAAAILLALIVGSPRGRAPFAIPLVAFGICFLIYVTDSFWASRRVRTAMRGTTAGPSPQSPPEPDLLQLTTTRNSDGSSFSLRGLEDNHGIRAPRQRSTVFYDKTGILGAGTPLTPVTFTVAVDKPQEGKTIDPFDVSGLLEQISAYVESQGTINDRSDGYAHRRVWIKGQWHWLDIPAPRENERFSRPGRLPDQGNAAFTHGLPNLDVDEVIAIPGPRVRLRPLWRIVARRVLMHVLRINRRQPPGAGDSPAPSDSPSVFPARRYVRARTVTWDGELIISVYVGAALQAHYLRLIIRPYILAPMVPHLRQVEDIADQNIIVHLVVAIRGTALGLFRAATVASKFGRRRDQTARRKSKRTRLLSTRERYAMNDTDSVHHQEDARRIFQVVQMKIFDVTETYLEEHNVDIEEFKKQMQIFIEKSMFISGGDNSGNFSIGDNNRQQQGSPGGSPGEKDTGNGNGK